MRYWELKLLSVSVIFASSHNTNGVYIGLNMSNSAGVCGVPASPNEAIPQQQGQFLSPTAGSSLHAASKKASEFLTAVYKSKMQTLYSAVPLFRRIFNFHIHACNTCILSSIRGYYSSADMRVIMQIEWVVLFQNIVLTRFLFCLYLMFIFNNLQGTTSF